MAEQKERSVKTINLQVKMHDKEIDKDLPLFDRGHKEKSYVSRALWSRPYGFYLKTFCTYKGADYILEVRMTKTEPTKEQPSSP